MCKFSIIVPVFNTEKYLERCLNSLIKQTFNDYEIIIINDGSFDNSKLVIERYLPNNKIKFINQENKGLSEARNKGLEIALGDYLLFVDSDDYVKEDLLEKINSCLNDDYDLIKLQYQNGFTSGNEDVLDQIELNKKYEAHDYYLKMLKMKKPFEMAWIYVYKRQFWMNKKFKFRANTYHEDFGLIPLVILSACKIYVSDIIGYIYNQEGTSITRNTDYQKTIKKAYDMLIHFDFLYEKVNDLELSIKVRKYFNSYLANSLITKIDTLNKEDRKKYIHELKMRKVFDLLIDDTIFRKIKKLILKLKY